MLKAATTSKKKATKSGATSTVTKTKGKKAVSGVAPNVLSEEGSRANVSVLEQQKILRAKVHALSAHSPFTFVEYFWTTERF